MSIKGDQVPCLDKGFVQLVDYMGSDSSIVQAARVSFNAESKGLEADKKLLAYLFKNKHTSPFEMVKVMFVIKMPIFVARQYIRHRMQNVNEVSMRYTEVSDDFYIPTEWRQNLEKGQNKQQSIAPSEMWDPMMCIGPEHDPWDATASMQLEDLFPWTMECYEKYKFPCVEMPEPKD